MLEFSHNQQGKQQMSESIHPLINPEKAAHEIVLELIKAGKISYVSEAKEAFTQLTDHYRAEKKRQFEESKAQ
ncbi:hypothetical protein AI2711V1_2403 [Raoultella ornithinolytica]|nr:hypothetical protein AI2711V1_2403 [Raoultella ornithinolytica]CAH3506711.1 hypothetical protein AI2711V1_2403 [Raoultella ornithinolytica]